MSDPVAELNAVVARLVGKEIVGAEIRWLHGGHVPEELRLRFYGGEELHINGVGLRDGDTAVSLDLISVR